MEHGKGAIVHFCPVESVGFHVILLKGLSGVPCYFGEWVGFLLGGFMFLGVS